MSRGSPKDTTTSVTDADSSGIVPFILANHGDLPLLATHFVRAVVASRVFAHIVSFANPTVVQWTFVDDYYTVDEEICAQAVR